MHYNYNYCLLFNVGKLKKKHCKNAIAFSNLSNRIKAKAVNRGDKRTRRVRDRDFVKFERSRRYRDRHRCQEKKSRRGRARDLVFQDPPTPRRDLDRCSRFATSPILP